MKISAHLLTTLTLSFLVSACGGRSPKTVTPKPQPQAEELGPQKESTTVSIDSDQLLFDDSLAQYKKTRATCKKEDYRASMNDARAYLKSKQYQRSLKVFEDLRKCKNPELPLLISALKEKIYGDQLTQAQCAELLVSWQEYVAIYRAQTKDHLAHYNRAIKRSNQLGEQCGAWASWRTEPSEARLFVQGHALGMSPVSVWLPVGEVSYTAKKSTRRHQGTLSIKGGEEVSLTTRLTDIINPPYQIKASILCDRPSSEEPLKRCTGSLLPGDRFRVTVKAGEEPVHLYVMSVNERSADLIFPARRAAPLKPKSVTALPTDDAYQLDDQTKSDAVVVMTSLSRVELLTQPSQGEKKSAWERELRALIEGARVADQDVVTEGSDEQSWVMIRWNLKPNGEGSTPSGDQS